MSDFSEVARWTGRDSALPARIEAEIAGAAA